MSDASDECSREQRQAQPAEYQRQLLTPFEREFPLAGDDAAWALDDVEVQAELETPEDDRRWMESHFHQPHPAGSDWVGSAVSAVWTAAQVAATAGALGAYVASAARKWRDNRLTFPEGTRLTLTLTPARKDDRRSRAQLVIRDIHAKTASDITNEIHEQLMTYAREREHGPSWLPFRSSHPEGSSQDRGAE